MLRTEQMSRKCPTRCESTGRGRAAAIQVFNASTERQKLCVVYETAGELFWSSPDNLKWQSLSRNHSDYLTLAVGE